MIIILMSYYNQFYESRLSFLLVIIIMIIISHYNNFY